MRIILVWMIFPGVWAVSGPSQVTASQGSSLSVSCSYRLGSKLHSKVWCKPYFFKIFCSYMAQTNGSEAAMTQGRVSIRDNHTALVFTVTMRDVMPEDAGWYYCGAVKSLWHITGNRWHKTEVLVSEATAEAGDVHPLPKAEPSPTGCEEPPALSQLDITLLLLVLGVKVPAILALLCGAVWLRRWHRSCSPWENLQQSEKSSSTAAPGSSAPQQPDPPAAPQRPSGPLPHTLPGLSHCSCSASGSSPHAKPQPLLMPPKLHEGRISVQRSRVC
ncbi:protein CD300H-like isoform X2 [Centrocercus urophasianus]|uniref:protein CD300H-like isoform X2 n=1 Tax=Centrocercus urophasianus TaxID=9002 RepID=UPI001C65190B|nr:protein CD300H-like isoform X2 [Centrocercus urophasianus]